MALPETLNVNLNPKSGISTLKVQINQEQSGSITTTTPVTLKNIAIDKTDSIEDIVDIINKVDGATVVYNSETGHYELKVPTMDGGLF